MAKGAARGYAGRYVKKSEAAGSKRRRIKVTRVLRRTRVLIGKDAQD